MKMLVPKTKYIWLDGKFVPFDKANIHFLNHSLHYGSGVFEGERFYGTNRGPAIFRLKDHTRRLFHSAKTLGIRVPYTPKTIMRATKELVKKNNLREGYIRPLIFYGGKMGLNPSGSPVHVGIAAWPWGAYLGEKPVKVSIASIMRLHPQSIVSTAKVSGYYANSILATIEAKKRGFDEALLLDYEGNIAEGPGENIFMVKRGKLYTPQLGAILPGITRNSVITIAKNLGLKVYEKKLKPHDLKSADELFFTGTAAEVTPIESIDGKKISRGLIGPVTLRIKSIYHKVIHGEEKRYYPWLDFVK